MQQTEIITFIIVGNIILLVFIVGIILFMLQYKKRKAEHEKEKLMINQKHTQELLNTQIEMQLHTMQHIGREIHDSVGQKLTLASLYTQQLSYENKAPQVTDKIENISSIINDSLKELRQLSKSLTDDNVAENDMVSLLQYECDKINGLKNAKVHFNNNAGFINATYNQKSILLRVIQEFIQNCLKHAQCKNIHIELSKNQNSFSIKIADDGVGFDKNKIKNKGIGLKNMEKRISIIDGKFDLQTTIGKGTTLTVEIPI